MAKDPIKKTIRDIDKQIDELEAELEPYYAIKAKIDALRAARRALTGGNKLTGEGGNRIRQQDVVEYFRNNPGSNTTEAAKALGATYSQVSSHLTRGKNERFLNKDGRWWVRDPKNGLNTVDDIEDDDE